MREYGNRNIKRNNIKRHVARKIGMAINQHGMIKEGDKVLVGISGGKDSLTLLKVLEERKRWVPIDYEVKAIYVATDYDKHPERTKRKLKKCLEPFGCECFFKEAAIMRTDRTGRRDCFWCSWNRRKIMFETAGEIGFNKVALGHNKDDIVETILMNMIWGGELSSINPVQKLFDGKITIIRPLVFLEEKEILRYVEACSLSWVGSVCPRSRDSKRAVVKNIITRLAKENRYVKSNILGAPHRIRTEYLTRLREM